MNKIEKMAQQDAERWAAAEMFYGDGAGTRRKLLNAEVQDKYLQIPGYIEAFNKAYESLDMTKFAKAAVKERQRIDRAAKAGKNLRALKSGNIRGLSTGLYIIVGGAYVAHVTGYDKKIEAEAKKLYKKAKTEIKYRKAKMQGKNVEKIFHSNHGMERDS